MKVSKEIQKKMHKIAEYTNKAKELSTEVNQYFSDKGFNIEELHCGNGKSLEELEYGNDVTDEFCKHAESDFADESLWNSIDIKRR